MCMVSVIMSTFNEEIYYVKQAVESILEQTYTDFEFIIVLDNPDNKELNNCVLEYEKIDNRVKVIKNKINIGLANSLNKAINIAKGEYIVRMDADDISHKQRIECEINYLIHNDLDLVGALKQDIDQEGNIILKQNNKKIPDELISKMLTLYDCIPHPTWLVKRDIYILLDGYRELARSQDYDFLLRARKKNIRMGVCDMILLQYRVNPNGISNSQPLKQKLVAKYLSDHYKIIEKITIDEIKEYIEKNATEEENDKYIKANNLYTEAKSISKKRPFIAVALIVKACRKSKFFLSNFEIILKKYLLLTIYRIGRK